MTDNESLWAEYDAEPDDFWVGMAQRMLEAERRWWEQHGSLALLRSVCAGSETRHWTTLWGRTIEDVCTGL